MNPDRLSATRPGGLGLERQRRLSVLATGVVTAVCAGLAVLACLSALGTGNENDRSEVAQLVWRASDADNPADTASGRGRLAEETAARRLALNPYDLQALTDLAVQAGRSNDRAALIRRVAQISRLSRRDTAAELWRMREGLASGDFDMAFRSIDLLLRRNASPDTLLVFETASVLDQPSARQALISRMTSRPVWRAGFVRRLALSAPIPDLDSLFLEMSEANLQIEGREFEPLLRRHLAIKDYAGARQIWDRLYPDEGPDSLVHDGGFQGHPGPPPFNWQVITDNEGAVEWNPSSGRSGRHLRVRHDLYSSSQPLIGQYVLLPAGMMQISIRARAVSGLSDERFRLELVCFGGPVFFKHRIRARAADWTTTTAQFSRPVRDCEAQVLRLVPVIGDRAEPVEADFDDLQIQPGASNAPAGKAALR